MNIILHIVGGKNSYKELKGHLRTLHPTYINIIADTLKATCFLQFLIIISVLKPI